MSNPERWSWLAYPYLMYVAGRLDAVGRAGTVVIDPVRDLAFMVGVGQILPCPACQEHYRGLCKEHGAFLQRCCQRNERLKWFLFVRLQVGKTGACTALLADIRQGKRVQQQFYLFAMCVALYYDEARQPAFSASVLRWLQDQFGIAEYLPSAWRRFHAHLRRRLMPEHNTPDSLLVAIDRTMHRQWPWPGMHATDERRLDWVREYFHSA